MPDLRGAHVKLYFSALHFCCLQVQGVQFLGPKSKSKVDLELNSRF